MEELVKTFKESLTSMSELASRHNYKGCTRMAGQLISACALLGYADGVFVGEVLQAAFDQLADTMDYYQVSQQEHRPLTLKLVELLSSIEESLAKNDKRDLYTALRDMRYLVTSFQFSTHSHTARKPSREEAMLDVGLG